jgi:ribonuclease R
MLSLEERIINLLKKHSSTRRLLLEFFSDNKKTNDAIDKLLKDGTLVQDGKEIYLASTLKLVKGKIVSIKARFSFASIGEEDDVYIDNRNLNGAFIDDIVYLRKLKGTKDEYEVFEVLERGRKQIVGELVKNGSYYEVIVKDLTSPSHKFFLNPTKESLFNGYIVATYLDRTVDDITFLDLVSVIGHKQDPGVDISRIILSADAPIEFPFDVREQLKEIPQEVSKEEEVGRKDFTDHLIVTLDGETAKDFDDAVEVVRDGDGYKVGVHIADVSHYVKEGSPLDKEAFSRGTSIYVTDRVVPMLPIELSNGICSLNPGVKRLVHSCIFHVDSEGNLSEPEIYQGIIESKGRLTYTYANKLFNKELKEDEHKSKEIDELLYLLREVSRKIRKRRGREGALNLDTTELQFLVDEKGEPYDVIKRTQGEGEKLIEDLMISANEMVATIFEKKNIPFIYRIHEQPKAKKMEAFISLSGHLGYKCNFSSLAVEPIDLARYLDSFENGQDKEIISMMLLRSLAKARYCCDNKGHFGLASKCYCHFTSPIRRYPDLIVAREIDRFLIDKDNEYDLTFVDNLNYIAEDTSAKERRAMTIERAVDDLESAKYMSKHIGEQFSGIITGMTNNGLFVETSIGIEGYIDYVSLEDDFYVFDEQYMTARGKFHHHEHHLGDEVDITVVSVNIEASQITFELVNNETTKVSKKTQKEHKSKENAHRRRHSSSKKGKKHGRR